MMASGLEKTHAWLRTGLQGSGSALSGRSAKRRCPGGRECGAALLELALTIPIAIAAFTCLMQFGLYINNELELQNGTSLAGQYLSVNRGTTVAADPCSLFASTFASLSPHLNSANASFAYFFTGSGSYGSYTGTTCAAGAAYMVQGDTVVVTATYPCSLAIYGVNLAPGCNISARVSEIIQ